MRKFIAAIMSITMILGFSACGKKEVRYAKQPDRQAASEGTIENGVYVSDFAGIKFTIPEGFRANTEEEMQQLRDSAGGAYIYDMMCQNEKTGSNVIVMYENIMDSFGRTQITAEEYMDLAEEQMAASGYTIENRYKESICGKEYEALEISVNMEEIEAKQYSYIRCEGDYMISVIIAVMDSDSIDKVMAGFGEF